MTTYIIWNCERHTFNNVCFQASNSKSVIFSFGKADLAKFLCKCQTYFHGHIIWVFLIFWFKISLTYAERLMPSWRIDDDKYLIYFWSAYQESFVTWDFVLQNMRLLHSVNTYTILLFFFTCRIDIDFRNWYFPRIPEVMSKPIFN